MRVAFINMPIEFYSPVSGGAISTIIAETARALVSLGHSVDVLTRLDDSPTHAAGTVVPLRVRDREALSILRRKWSGLRRRVHGWDWPGFDMYLAAVLRSIEGGAYDAIIVFNDLVTPRYLRRRAPGAVILSWLQNEWRTNQRSLRPTREATDRFLTCSDAIRHWTHRTHEIPLSKLETVHSGVNLSQFSPSGRSGEQRPLRVLYVGRIDPNKGPDIAARAVAQLQADGYAVTFEVAGGVWFYRADRHGNDPFQASLSEQVRAVGGAMLGHVTRDRLPDVYRASDVVCVLSRSQEPFGLVALEAMASGCAVLASNRGGLPEACGGAGVLVDPDDFEAVVAQLRRWARDREALAADQERCRERAERASWAAVAAKVEQVIEDAAAERFQRASVAR